MARSAQDTYTALSWPVPRGEDLTTETGAHCPRTGLWSPAQDSARKVPLTRGALMPAREGAPVPWTYQGPTLHPHQQETTRSKP